MIFYVKFNEGHNSLLNKPWSAMILNGFITRYFNHFYGWFDQNKLNKSSKQFSPQLTKMLFLRQKATYISCTQTLIINHGLMTFLTQKFWADLFPYFETGLLGQWTEIWAQTVHLMDWFGHWTKIIILRWTSGLIFDNGPLDHPLHGRIRTTDH